MKILLWVVAAMVAYDLSIHLIYLFGQERFLLERKLNYRPNWHDRGWNYQLFWSLFWGIALLLLLTYIFTS